MPMPGDPRERLRAELSRLGQRARQAQLASRHARMTATLLGILALAGALQMSADAWLGPHGSDLLLLAGANIPARVVRGEWWRLWTGLLLHGDALHLLVNALGLYLMGRPLEMAYGPLRLWLIFLAAGLGGSLATLTGHAMLSIGASGAVFGLLGALIALGIKLWPRLATRQRFSLVAAPTALLLLMLVFGALAGEDRSRIDRLAHLGGALGGLAAGLLLHPRIHRSEARAHRFLWREAGLRAVAWGMAGLLVAACLLALLRIGKPVELLPLQRQTFAYEGLTVPYPAGVRRGLWQGAACRGAMVDGAWALRTGRQPCFELPLGATLIVSRRDQQLTFDQKDIEALQTANRTGRMAWRQDNVMLYPLGANLLYWVLAREAVLPSAAAALQAILPPAHSATVTDKPRPGPLEWFVLPVEITPTT